MCVCVCVFVFVCLFTISNQTFELTSSYMLQVIYKKFIGGIYFVFSVVINDD